MDKQVAKQQKRLEKQQEKLLNKKEKANNKLDDFIESCESKIPSALKATLNSAFYKGFQIVFEKGSEFIEKTYPKEQRQVEYAANNLYIHNHLTKQGFRKIDGQVWKNNVVNSCTAFAEGAGLGVLGIGLPDIPLFIAVLLKGIYETAVSYGFDHESESERVWILRIIRTALSDGEEKRGFHNEVTELMKDLIVGNNKNNKVFDFQAEIKKTSEVLSQSMLVMKFVQGLPIVGVIGSVGNFSIYQKVAAYCNIQYKLRYIKNLEKI